RQEATRRLQEDYKKGRGADVRCPLLLLPLLPLLRPGLLRRRFHPFLLLYFLLSFSIFLSYYPILFLLLAIHYPSPFLRQSRRSRFRHLRWRIPSPCGVPHQPLELLDDVAVTLAGRVGRAYRWCYSACRPAEGKGSVYSCNVRKESCRRRRRRRHRGPRQQATNRNVSKRL
ncbi:hypothetical protein F5879DRAFT_1029017, partial [Lentinula edodes]